MWGSDVYKRQMEQCGYDTGVPDVSTWVSGSISDMDGDTVTDA